jgi:Tol biopolymer transport system component
MRTFGASCALTAVLAFLLSASGAQGYLVTAATATLPARYLVTLYNPTVNATTPGAKVDSVEILDGHGRVLRRVEQGCCWGGDARFSPNGKRVAWVDKRGLNVENASGTRRRLLVAAAAHCATVCVGMSYAWAPDSDTIAVGGAGAQTDELLSVDVQTGIATRIALVARFTEYQVIGYSPDGRQLAVDKQSGDAGTASCCESLLLVEHTDGTSQRLLFSFFDAIHDGPQDATWSPDGHELAFTDDGMDTRDPRFAVVDVATARVRRINGFVPADAPPIWSPDGTKLTAVRYVRQPIYTVSTFNLETDTVTKIGLGDDPFAWYPDGTILATGGANGNILYRLSSTGGPQRRIFTLPKPLRFLTIEPRP